MNNKFKVLFIALLLVGISLAYSISQAKPNSLKAEEKTSFVNGRIDSYTLLGKEWVYYQIPSGLSREELVSVAQNLHQAEPKANLILVDDVSKINDYIEFAKVINPGYLDPEMPKDWADKHIVANVRNHYWSGKFILCEGYGDKKITELTR